ncbi:cell division regulator GpsB [Alkalihalobacillus sp. AL-G]|uniref:cell division regulator GpsB n=1 Tax=Alkalihalobacillus sp. AL-G TaxID=2926399 RepID=UPI00272A0CE1|nr:cell division regulator GpsB [Alkalihalobacillus sp. AL-G]WLD91751.1 cell division regulator GpsB [Alkalihalobacillus sp. AL-G]
MDMKKLRLNAKEILEKDFKTGFRGYDQDEVDQFLDVVIKDYEQFHKEIDRLNEENVKLKKEVQRSGEQSKSQTNSPGITNYDILKRLSNLEKHVFGSKLYD